MESVDWVRLESDLPFDQAIYEVNADGTPGCLHIGYDSAVQRRQALTGETNGRSGYTAVEVK